MTDTLQGCIARIAEIDTMFEGATGWGSWMVMAANEREDLVNRVNGRWLMDEPLKHKYQARTASGGRTD
jgi:hypothetical protein